MDEFFGGIIMGAVVVGFVCFLLMGGLSQENTLNQNRALSCMSAGNTVAQCQDILGIKKN